MVASDGLAAPSRRHTVPLSELLERGMPAARTPATLDTRDKTGNGTHCQQAFQPYVEYSSTTQNVGLCNPVDMVQIAMDYACSPNAGPGSCHAGLQPDCSFNDKTVKVDPPVGQCTVSIDGQWQDGHGDLLGKMVIESLRAYMDHQGDKASKTLQETGFTLQQYTMPSTIVAGLRNYNYGPGVETLDKGKASSGKTHASNTDKQAGDPCVTIYANDPPKMTMTVDCKADAGSTLTCDSLKGFLGALVSILGGLVSTFAPELKLPEEALKKGLQSAAISAGTSAATTGSQTGLGNSGVCSK